MKSVLFTTLFMICAVHSTRLQRQSSSKFSSYPSSQYGLGNQDISGYGLSDVSLTLSNHYSDGSSNQFQQIPQTDFYSQFKDNIYSVASSNSVEKPVQEDQDTPPQPLPGPAVIPQQPPPAVPVNAVAANVPSNNGAVFLGSGSLGVVNLGNGQYALGAGGIGYSDTRQQPRPNLNSPLYPPLSAKPNLVPAATPSQVPVQIPQGAPPSQISPNGFHFSQPLFIQAQQRLIDQNGYESLTANDAGFGSPTPIIRPLKITSNYATPSQQLVPLPPLQLLPQQPFQLNPQQLSQQLSPGFGGQVLQYPTLALKYQ